MTVHEIKELAEEYQGLFWNIDHAKKILTHYTENKLGLVEIECYACIPYEVGNKYSFKIPIEPFVSYMESYLEKLENRKKEIEDFLSNIEAI